MAGVHLLLVPWITRVFSWCVGFRGKHISRNIFEQEDLCDWFEWRVEGS